MGAAASARFKYEVIMFVLNFRRLTLTSLALALLPILAIVAPASAATIQVEDVRAIHDGKNAKIFMTITNSGAADRLFLVKSKGAKMAKLHMGKVKKHKMKMDQVMALKVDSGQSINLNPDGRHIMLMGLKKAPKKGEQITVTLFFKMAGKVKVSAPFE